MHSFRQRRKSHEEDDVRRNRSFRRGLASSIEFGCVRAGEQHSGVFVLAAAVGAQEEAEEAEKAAYACEARRRGKRPVAIIRSTATKPSDVSSEEKKPASATMRVFVCRRGGSREIRRPREYPCCAFARGAACRGTDKRAARARWESRAARALPRLRGNGRRARRALSCR